MRPPLIAVLVSACILGAISAAEPQTAIVSGTGTVEIKRPAEILRVQFDVMARGKNLTDAIEKLKTRREVVIAELAKMGASKDSVFFGDNDVLDEASDRQNQLGRMMASRNRALGKSPKPKTEALTILYVPIKVDFPLPSNKPDELLVVTRTLQEKIKVAELGGLKTDGKASPEEEEQVEESVGMTGRGGEEQPRGTPTFLYVFKLTEADRKKALSDAFAQAKQDARRLAQAAGMDLGELYKLIDQSQSSVDPDEIMTMMRRDYGYGRYGNGGMGSLLVGDEAIGMSPGKAAVRVGVVAQFRLASSK